MMEDNNKARWPFMTEDDQETGEIVSWYMPPELLEEPEEIVSWYMPPEEEDEPQEEIGADAPKKRRMSGWKKTLVRVLLGTLAACILLSAGAGGAMLLLKGMAPDQRRGDGELKPGDGDSASSIIDVTDDEDKTMIPLYHGKSSVRLEINRRRGAEMDAVEIYQKVNPSVVTVVAETLDGASVGTGVIMSADGYIVTNAHVISGGRSCWVALDSGVTLDAFLVGYDKDEDLAVLKAAGQNNLPAAEFGDSESLQVGERVYAIGNPLGIELRGTLTDGIVSAVNRQVEVGEGHMTMIQTTAALNNGNSGGPLINSSGQIVGINTLKMGNGDGKDKATVEGLGFALPTGSVSFVVNDIIATGTFRGVPTIGITVITQQDEEGNTWVEVYSVAENMGAAQAGVKEGDIIVKADGQPIYKSDDLQAVRRNHSIGDTITLTILRDGKNVDIDVVLFSNKEWKN